MFSDSVFLFDNNEGKEEEEEVNINKIINNNKKNIFDYDFFMDASDSVNNDYTLLMENVWVNTKKRKLSSLSSTPPPTLILTKNNDTNYWNIENDLLNKKNDKWFIHHFGDNLIHVIEDRISNEDDYYRDMIEEEGIGFDIENYNFNYMYINKDSDNKNDNNKEIHNISILNEDIILHYYIDDNQSIIDDNQPIIEKHKLIDFIIDHNVNECSYDIYMKEYIKNNCIDNQTDNIARIFITLYNDIWNSIIEFGNFHFFELLVLSRTCHSLRNNPYLKSRLDRFLPYKSSYKSERNNDSIGRMLCIKCKKRSQTLSVLPKIWYKLITPNHICKKHFKEFYGKYIFTGRYIKEYFEFLVKYILNDSRIHSLPYSSKKFLQYPLNEKIIDERKFFLPEVLYYFIRDLC